MANPAKGSLPDPAVIKAHLNNLASAAASLNQATESLSQIVTQIENRINGLNIGVEASARISSWSDENNCSGEFRLTYQKIEATKRWGFQIDSYETDPFGDTACESWAFKDAPRDLRMSAVQAIPDLLTNLEKTSARVIETVAINLSFAKEILLQLSPNSNSGKG